MAAEIGLLGDGEDDLLEENSAKPIVYSDEVEEAIGKVSNKFCFSEKDRCTLTNGMILRRGNTDTASQYFQNFKSLNRYRI